MIVIILNIFPSFFQSMYLKKRLTPQKPKESYFDIIDPNELEEPVYASTIASSFPVPQKPVLKIEKLVNDVFLPTPLKVKRDYKYLFKQPKANLHLRNLAYKSTFILVNSAKKRKLDSEG